MACQSARLGSRWKLKIKIRKSLKALSCSYNWGFRLSWLGSHRHHLLKCLVKARIADHCSGIGRISVSAIATRNGNGQTGHLRSLSYLLIQASCDESLNNRELLQLDGVLLLTLLLDG